MCIRDRSLISVIIHVIRDVTTNDCKISLIIDFSNRVFLYVDELRNKKVEAKQCKTTLGYTYVVFSNRINFMSVKQTGRCNIMLGMQFITGNKVLQYVLLH